MIPDLGEVRVFSFSGCLRGYGVSGFSFLTGYYGVGIVGVCSDAIDSFNFLGGYSGMGRVCL